MKSPLSTEISRQIERTLPSDYTDDLKFWMIDENFLESCCQDKLMARREAILAEVAKHNQQDEEEEVEDFGEGHFVPYQRALWDLLQKPQSSLPAKVQTGPLLVPDSDHADAS